MKEPSGADLKSGTAGVSPRRAGPVIVSAADNGYAMPLAVMLRSLGANLRGSEGATVYVLDGGIRPRNRRKVVASLVDCRLALRWVRPSHDAIADCPVSGHIPLSSYYKLLIPELLPHAVTKSVYIDADTVVLGDITELWEADMGGAPLMAVQNMDKLISSPDGVVRYRELGLPAEAKYLNAGVLVMDVAAWRQANLTGAVLDYLAENRAYVVYHDQDGINAVLAGRWRELDARWNYRVNCFRDGGGRAAAAVVAEIRNRASIVHYASRRKPWDFYAVHPGKALFFEYLDQTAWAGWRPSAPLRDRISNVHFYGALFRRIPVFGAAWSRMRGRGQEQRAKGKERRANGGEPRVKRADVSE